VKTRGAIATAESLARRHDEPFVTAYVMLAWAVCHVHDAEYAGAVRAAEQARLLFEERCREAAWEIGFSRIVAISAQSLLGRFRDMEAHFQTALREAEDRGNLYCVTTLVGMSRAIIDIAADRPDECEAQIQAVMKRWPVEDSLQHSFALMSYVMLDLYRGGGAAHERIESAWPRLERSLLLRYERLRVTSILHRGLAALAALVAGTCERKRGLRLVEECAARLARETVPVGGAHLLRAQAAHFVGKLSSAVGHYRAALHVYEASGVYLVHSTRARLAAIIGGDEAAAIVRDNDAWARQEGIRRLDRFFAVTAPVTVAKV
jgi:hypothetical protein